MLGSVVNTLEQRGEWLNGGRGAATALIDGPLGQSRAAIRGRRRTLGIFSEPVMIGEGLCREWLLAGEEE